MSVQVINIAKEHEVLLPFFYPTYSIAESPAVTRKFIARRDIKSKREREALSLYFDDCIFISTQIFDEFWDEDRIKQEAVNFVRKNFKSRKHTIQSSSETFVEDILKFMFELSTDEEDTTIHELFEAFGSARFAVKFIETTKVCPLPVVITSMNTFIGKILSDSSSIYYKKKAALYRDKIKANFVTALDNLNQSTYDEFGLSQIKFYTDLWQ